MIRISILGDIDRSTFQYVEDTLLNNLVNNHRDNHIDVFIDSIGGSVEYAWKIYDLLKSTKKEIRTYNIGSCNSSAVIIYLAGDIRYALKDSLFLLHQVCINLNGSYPTFKLIEFTKSNIEENQKLFLLIEELTNIDDDLLTEIYLDDTKRLDKKITSKTALKCKLCDKLIKNIWEI